MKQENAILIGLSIAAVGGLAFWYYKKKQDEKEAEAKKTAENNTNNPDITTGYPGPYTGPGEYQKKVMQLQSILGVAVDGDPGSQTNGALSKRLPLTYPKLGPVNNSNIAAYLVAVNIPFSK